MEKNYDQIIERRTEKLKQTILINYNWISYIVLAIIVFIATKIRISNLPGLKDITTGTWTLGPDLDPFLFLRWAKEIVANGSLQAVDHLRYVPLGFEPKGELILHTYLMVWFHKIAVFFGSSSMTQSAVIYPAFMFALTVIVFFLFTRRVFLFTHSKKQANLIALIASFFLSIIPAILPRTIAGIPEKESSGFFFLFLSFYLFILAWQSKGKKAYFFALLTGLSTAAMAGVWGGCSYVFVTIALAAFLAFFLSQITLEKFAIYSTWLISSAIFMHFVSLRYSLTNILSSVTTGIAFAVFFILLTHVIIFNTRIQEKIPQKMRKLPKPLISLIVGAILGLIIFSVLFDPTFIYHKIDSVYHVLISPSTDRLGVTVAENRQPFFDEWSGSFGPRVAKVPISFWLLTLGAILLFYNMLSALKNKEKIILTSSYVFFLIAMIFSRYKQDSIILNGTSLMSQLFYALGALALAGTSIYYIYHYHKNNEESTMKQIDFSLILFFALFFFSLISARGAVRLIMILVPAASINIAYLIVASYSIAKNLKDDFVKIIAWGILVLIIFSAIFASISFYKNSIGTAKAYVPSAYNQQWQKAMAWVRETLPQSAVFGHWWDYGYWVQSLGERATVLDGGNSMPYWNYLMGRYSLTGTDDKKSIEFLYSHNTTHFLIDSTDIGKYGAFSSIGSDENYDRQSWIPTVIRNNQQTQETKETFRYVYTTGIPLDGDIIYEQNGTKIFLPQGKAGIGAIIIEKSKNNTKIYQPKAIFVYQGKQYTLPLQYLYDSSGFYDFKSGISSGVYLMPRVIADANTITGLEVDGALLYLSNRTVRSQVARLYLQKENNPYFKLVHSEDDFLVSQIKQGSGMQDDIVFFNEVRGPIRIWEINYPAGMQVNQDYLSPVFIGKDLINEK